MEEVGQHQQRVNPRKKIFIAGVNTPLGYHLVECLRDDHRLLEGYSYIVGSQWQISDENYLHREIHRTIKYESEKGLLAKCVLESDIVIVNILEKREQTQYILEMLKQRANDQETFKGSCLVIGLASHMTWAYTKPKGSGIENMDKEIAIAKILEWDPRNDQPRTDEQEKTRVPHYRWNWHYEQEQKILNMNNKQNFLGHIVCTGLIYGKDFPCQPFSTILSSASTNQPITCYGEGNNIVPTSNIDDITTLIFQISEEKLQKRYWIVVDEKRMTQLEVIKVFQQATATLTPLRNLPQHFITEEQCEMSTNASLQRSQWQGSQNCLSLEQYMRENCTEICQYLELNPIRVFLKENDLMDQLKVSALNQDFTPDEQIAHIKQVFTKNHVRILQQSEVMNEEEESPFSEQYRNYLGKNIIKNHVLVTKDKDIGEDVLEQFTITKITFLGNLQETLKSLYNRFGFQQIELKKQQIANQQQNQSPGLDPVQPQPQAGVEVQSQEEQAQDPQPIEQKSIKQSESGSEIHPNNPPIYSWAASMDQYMLDNMLVYVSEAYLKLQQNKNQKSLHNFIQKLKQIYKRQQAIKEDECLLAS